MAEADLSSGIAARIRARLTALGKTARGASLEAGLGASTIRNVLEGRSQSPRGVTLAALARVLETSEGWILHGDAAQEGPTSALPVPPSAAAARRPRATGRRRAFSTTATACPSMPLPKGAMAR